ncbi:MAG: phosphatase PAP2 family protein [Proteobacteria bacterium]|jgi:undecaprenyl-diphosphatase|nr:phosphatase PAP2 family protein [Pseudomonadota bacterium]
MHLDDQAFLAVNRALSGDAAAAFFFAVSWLGNGAVLAAIIVPLLFAFSRGTLRRHLVPLVLATAVGGLAVLAIKIACARPRPPLHFAAIGVAVSAPDGVPPDSSFPSGHAQTAFAAAVYLALLFPRGAALFLALAALVGLSRVALGVHYPSDVLAGAALGSALSIAAFLIAKRMERQRASPG